MEFEKEYQIMTPGDKPNSADRFCAETNSLELAIRGASRVPGGFVHRKSDGAFMTDFDIKTWIKREVH